MLDAASDAHAQCGIFGSAGTFVTFVPVSEQLSNSSEDGNSCANFGYRFTFENMTVLLRDAKMIYKAAENFKTRTLSALPTLLERLAYICSLQLPDGGYRHWGLSRTYGTKPAQEAIQISHAELAAQLVHSPLQELYEEYKNAIGREDGPGVLRAESFVLNAPVSDDGLLDAHLRLLEDSMKALARQERTTPQVA